MMNVMNVLPKLHGDSNFNLYKLYKHKISSHIFD